MTHQLEPDGATGKGPGGERLPWRSERSSWVVLSVPGRGSSALHRLRSSWAAVGGRKLKGPRAQDLGCFGVRRARRGIADMAVASQL